MKKITAVFLAALLIFVSFAVPVFAAAGDETDDKYAIIDTELKSAYLAAFNKSVNAIKSEMPSCRMTTTYSIGEPTVGSLDGEIIDENARKWIGYIVDACFKNGSGMANTLFTTIFGDPSAPVDIEFQSGEKRNKRAPISGKDYVSGLTDDDSFWMTVRTTGNKLHPENNLTTTKIYFSDTTLENAKGSSLNKVFNMTEGEFNPIVVSDTVIDKNGNTSNNILDGVTFDNFSFSDAYAEAITNTKGELVTYATDITYSFTISLYDFVRLVSATAGFDFMAFAMAIADTVLQNTGKGGLNAEDVLRTKCLYINYNIRTEFTGFYWGNRSFGDIDNDEEVTVTDARLALREAVGIQPIKNQAALIYGDIDFDGDITVSDARLILRAAVGLDKSFSKVPDGKKITIVEVQDEIIIPPGEEEDDPTEEDPADPTDPGSSGTGGSGMIDISGDVADFVQSIFDVIEAIRGTEEGAQGALADIIEYFKNISKTEE